jgi:hypothetical protein
MRVAPALALAIGAALLGSGVGIVAQDRDRAVAGGGIQVPGWKGRIDPASAKQGRTINDSKFEQQGSSLHLAIGPAAIYWNPANAASGDFTVKATFREGKSSSDHPHPYGIFIGGSKLDTDNPSLLYCVPYGDGRVLVRGFSNGTPFTPLRATPNPAVNKAAADGSVTQDVQWTVKGGKAECLINGKVVASYDKSELIGEGKIDSLDGVYGIRVSHNVDVAVSGLTKN